MNQSYVTNNFFYYHFYHRDPATRGCRYPVGCVLHSFDNYISLIIFAFIALVMEFDRKNLQT